MSTVQINQPKLKPNHKKNGWNVVGDFYYVSQDGTIDFIIPDGFFTDLASIPSWATPFFDKSDPRTALAALVHDALIRLNVCSRERADLEFKNILDITAPESTEEIYYIAVSRFSWFLRKKREFTLWIESIKIRIKNAFNEH